LNPTFVLLGLAIATAWLPVPRVRGVPVPPWAVLLAAAAGAGLSTGVLAPTALGALVILCCLAAAACLAPRGRPLFTLLAATWALALALHVIPGFRNPRLFDGVRLTADAVPFTSYLNFDKAAGGLVLLAAFCRPGRGEGAGARRTIGWTLGAAAVTTATALGLATLAGLTRFEPKWPPDALAFLLANLLFTCVAEEAFFRGLIQERIARLAETTGNAAWRPAAVAIGALLFGLAHAGGGVAYAVVAGVASVGYGAVYAATRRIEAAILVHFALNAVHFLGFAYPVLARGA
jgi:hypothetical protein